MRGASLELFLFLFILNSIIGVEDAHPITGSDVPLSTDNNITTHINDAAAPVEPYECVYVPPNLEKCKYMNWSCKPSDKTCKLLEKMYTSRSICVPGMKKYQRQPSATIVVKKLIRCIPLRLPFILPCCTDEDLAAKTSVIEEFYPIFVQIPYEFPKYDDYLRKPPKVSKLA